jgi:dihydrolipoamide dehydrogenase
MTDYLKTILEEKGIKINTNKKVNKIKEENNMLLLETENGENIECDWVLLATGRTPNTSKIGIENYVDMEKGKIVVDGFMRTKTNNIYAVGDIVGEWMLAHVAIQEGLIAGENAVGGNVSINYDSIPRCVYSEPEIAFVGLSEQESLNAFDGNVESVYYPIHANGRAQTINAEKGLIKLIFEKKFGEILGAQIISPNASELIHGISFAMNIQATIEDLANTVYGHPTLSEIIREAALRALSRELHI